MHTDKLTYYQIILLILKRFFLILITSFLTAHLVTLFYYLVAENGQHSLFIKRTNQDFEIRRQLLLKNMSLVDKLFTVGYTSGFVDNLKDMELAEQKGNTNFYLSAQKNAEKMGTCEFNGKTVSMYAYYELRTTLGLQHKEYVITCKQVETKDIKGYLNRGLPR
jgi:hypothetical protein